MVTGAGVFFAWKDWTIKQQLNRRAAVHYWGNLLREGFQAWRRAVELEKYARAGALDVRLKLRWSLKAWRQGTQVRARIGQERPHAGSGARRH